MLQPRPKKSLGQHFLCQPEIARRIVALLDPLPGDHILEIGPGPGALTQLLLAAGPARLILLEKDSYWAERQKMTLAGSADYLVQCRDALGFAWESLEGPWKIVSNLPYNVASPLVWDIVSRTPQWTLCVFMVQKEVAERIIASPGGREYGALGVWVQSFAAVEWGFVVGPGNFSPPPKVDSAVISLRPLPDAARPRHPELLARMLQICFQQRRKQLQSILRRNGVPSPSTILESMGIVPQARPETLTPEQFQMLAITCADSLTSLPKRD